jgi:hypothetical protein
MTDYEFGDIILVRFPFTDQTTSKKRPAVVVSSPVYNRIRPDLVIMAVTSHTKPNVGFGETAIKDWNQAGLLKPSQLENWIVNSMRCRLADQKWVGKVSFFSIGRSGAVARCRLR